MASGVISYDKQKKMISMINDINNNIINLGNETYKRYENVKSRLDINNRGVYIMTDGDEKPNSNGAYLCVSHGKQGVDWNYYVDVYTLYGDPIPRYFFKIYSSDGINYFIEDYQNYIVESNIVQQRFSLNYTGSGTNQFFSFYIDKDIKTIISCELVNVGTTWETNIKHCNKRIIENNMIYFDFSADENQIYTYEVTFLK